MKNYMVLFSTQDEWGKQEVEAESIEEALIDIYGEELPGIEIDTREDGNTHFSWYDNHANYFTGILIPRENLEERVYLYKHDSEELLSFRDLLSCYKKITYSLEEAYGLEEAMEVLNSLLNSTDSTMNICLESWGDTTIFIMD